MGVGGEYDSTNIIEKPIVCGITALGLDHVSVLGDTIDKIAWHKSGIIKQDVPVVCFEQLPLAMEVVEKRAKDKNAPLTVLHADQVSLLDGIPIGLAGIHQKYNALTAVELSKIWLKRVRGIEFKEAIPEGFKKGLELVKWPGRGQKLSITETKYKSVGKDNATWYLDGAHTVESLGVCADWFKETMENSAYKDVVRVLVFNCTHGRDSGRLLKVITDIQSQVHFDHVVFTTNITFKEGYTTDNTNKTVSMEEVTSVQQILAESWKEQLPNFNKDNIHIVGTIEEAVEFAVDLSKNSPDSKHVQVLTTGSLIMVGNTLTVLGIEPQ